jgi:Ca-activated chloride channel family protein
MTLRLLISLELLSLAAWAARAQTAVEFFNSGAQFYISNNIPAALVKVENGRKLYPDDVKLKKLEELLKRQQQSQQNQQNQQQQQQQPQRNQQNQETQNQSNNQNNQQEQERQRQAQSQSAQPEQKSGQEETAKQKTAMAAQEMTPEEAQRLLDAQKGSELFLQLKPKEPPERPNRVLKDW